MPVSTPFHSPGQAEILPLPRLPDGEEEHCFGMKRTQLYSVLPFWDALLFAPFNFSYSEVCSNNIVFRFDAARERAGKAEMRSCDERGRVPDSPADGPLKFRKIKFPRTPDG